MVNKPTYIDKIVKLVIVRKSITRRELVEKVHQITKINSNKHQFHLTRANSTRALSSNENIKWWWHMSNVWIVPGCEFDRAYMEKDIVSYRKHEGHEEFTHMLDLDNKSMCFISLLYNTQVTVNFILVFICLFLLSV